VRSVPSVGESGTANDAAATEQVTQAMQRYLPGDDLLFLMQLSVPPMRQVLARETQEGPQQ
jgi:hypothetical protein